MLCQEALLVVLLLRGPEVALVFMHMRGEVVMLSVGLPHRPERRKNGCHGEVATDAAPERAVGERTMTGVMTDHEESGVDHAGEPVPTATKT